MNKNTMKQVLQLIAFGLINIAIGLRIALNIL